MAIIAFADFDVNYLTSLDSSLMYMSKGSLDYNSLRFMSIRSKHRYLDRFSELYKTINENSKSDNTSTD